MNILAFGASNSAASINRLLAEQTAGMVPGARVDVLDIHDYELPLFSPEREAALGQPSLAREFLARIAAADALVVSFAEHNGGYTAAYKNLFDWASRLDRRVYQDKPALFLATSPGRGGAAGVLATAVESAAHFGAHLVASMAVPDFHNQYDVPSGRWVNLRTAAALREAARGLETHRARGAPRDRLSVNG